MYVDSRCHGVNIGVKRERKKKEKKGTLSSHPQDRGSPYDGGVFKIRIPHLILVASLVVGSNKVVCIEYIFYINIRYISPNKLTTPFNRDHSTNMNMDY